ncbi:MAG TPA: FlgD immunoglobulin-like domain containing protein [Spirochaetota bacterium]|nr:FlgD immunoglobulin-like domain containing protein [Spirochaetota bacterium]
MRNKAKTLAALLLAGCVASTAAFALDMSGVMAYPVPFNPDKKTLTIGGLPPGASDIRIKIFDINGDSVFERSYSPAATTIEWSGRNNSGRKVKPGLYIIKVTAEDSATGNYGKKLIRILVDYK